MQHDPRFLQFMALIIVALVADSSAAERRPRTAVKAEQPLVQPLPRSSPAPAPLKQNYILSRGPNNRRVASVTWSAEGDGTLRPRTNSCYTIIETGMHYWEDNQWKDSQDVIELTPDGGAAALRGQHRLRLKADISSDSAISITSKENRVYQTHPTGIYLYEPQSDRTIQLAPVNPHAVAELHPPNQDRNGRCLVPLRSFLPL